MTEAKKPKEPTGTLEEKQVPEVEEPTPKPDDPSTEAQSDKAEEKLKKMESELGRFKQELGDERKKSEELNAYKLWYDQNAKQQQVPQKPPEKPNYDEQWFDKPTETFDRMSQQRDMKQAYNNAYQQAPMAKAMAKMQHPEAFEGITDTELEQAMFGGVQSGTTNPHILGDPNAWVGAAWILRGPKLGFKLPGAPPAGMSTTETETPGASPSPPDKEIPEDRGDDLTELLMKRRPKEVTKEKFLEKRQEISEAGKR